MKFNKILMTLIVTGLSLQSINTSADIGQSSFAPPIEGFYPILKSVGSYVIKDGVLKPDGTIGLQVGSYVQVPTDRLTLDEAYYTYWDKDEDPDTSEKLEVRWFILDDPNWNTITQWSDIDSIVEIGPENLISNYNSQSIRSDVLIVPPNAVGKRIGFTIVPKSLYGVPTIGNRLYAWDLGKFWKQNEPETTGNAPANPATTDPKKITPSEEGNAGTANGVNKQGGGGIVEGIQDNVLFSLFDTQGTDDLSDDVLLTNDDVVNVDKTYRVEVRLIDKDKFRLINADEEKNITWELLEGDTVKYAGNFTDTNFANRFVQPESKKTSNLFFRTQKNNEVSIAQHSINKSEQGLTLRIKYNDDKK